MDLIDIFPCELITRCHGTSLPEGKAAMAGGLMQNDYELGKEYYFEALDEIFQFEFPEKSKFNRAFEFGFSQLTIPDRIAALPKYLEVLNLYGRFDPVPQPKQYQLVRIEDVLTSEYLDALHDWFGGVRIQGWTFSSQ